MSSPGRMAEVSDESRRRILDAAEALFAEHGFVETSLAQVAERSGISRGSIPWHFENKVGLLMAVVERSTRRASTAPLSPGLSALDRSAKDIAQRLREPHMALLHTLLGEASKPDSAIRDAYAKYHEDGRTEIRSWLEDSPDVAVSDVDSDELSTLIYALVIGIHVQWRIDPDRIDLDHTLATMARLLSAATAG